MAMQLANIVGIEVRITRLECKRKLNQHHQAPDREGAIRGLEAKRNLDLAQAMRNTGKPLARLRGSNAGRFTRPDSSTFDTTRQAPTYQRLACHAF